MLAIALTIAPIFLLILLGFAFKRFGFPGDDFWRPAERLSYFVLLPVLIVRNLAKADLSTLPIDRITIALLCMSIIMTGVVLIVKPMLRLSGPAYTSVLQGVIRLNAYIGFAVSEALFGTEGLVLASLIVAIMMPAVNVISIVALAAFVSPDGRPSWRNVPGEIIRNPIILACLIGWLVNMSGLSLPGWLMATMSIIGGAALPIALLCVGAALILQFDSARVIGLAVTCVLKLAIMPVIGAVLAIYFGLESVSFVVVMLFAATPASPASYVLARQLGGDAPLMAAILSLETLLAAITIPIIVYWAMVRTGLA
jgi:malonate transporter and related proteins